MTEGSLKFQSGQISADIPVDDSILHEAKSAESAACASAESAEPVPSGSTTDPSPNPVLPLRRSRRQV